MLKTFDINTERFGGTDFQENKYAKIFSVPKNLISANNYSDDIQIAFDVYWISNYHYAKYGKYVLSVKQDLQSCILHYLGEETTTYYENGVCYKVTDTDIEIYVRGGASNYSVRVTVDGNSKYYLYGKWYNYAKFEDIQTSTLTSATVVNKTFETLVNNVLSATIKNNVETYVNNNATVEVFRSPYTTKKLYNCSLRINVNASETGSGILTIYVNGKAHGTIGINYKNGDTKAYYTSLISIYDSGNMYCQFYHYNSGGTGVTITVTPFTN